MPKTLALVTCSHQLEVAFVPASGRVPSLVRLTGGAPRSTFILGAIDLVLEESETDRSDLGLILATRGPGSFTGVRAGLATAEGLSAALDIPLAAHSSLAVQAWRCGTGTAVWAAQPGRRGEVYAQRFQERDRTWSAASDILILAADELPADAPWIAAETVDLGNAHRAPAVRSASEALLAISEAGVEGQPPEPMYVEGPPVGKRNC